MRGLKKTLKKVEGLDLGKNKIKVVLLILLRLMSYGERPWMF